MYNNIQQEQTTNDTTSKVPWMNSSSSKRATHHICWNRTTGWLVWCLSTLPTIVLPPFAQDVCTEIGNFIWIIKILHALRENCLFIQWAPYLYLSLSLGLALRPKCFQTIAIRWKWWWPYILCALLFLLKRCPFYSTVAACQRAGFIIGQEYLGQESLFKFSPITHTSNDVAIK